MRTAYNKCKTITGSSTCCVASIGKTEATVTIANVGDSGALVYRPSEKKILFQTEEQTHDFNFPKQLGTNSDDKPEHADVTPIEVLCFIFTKHIFFCIVANSASVVSISNEIIRRTSTRDLRLNKFDTILFNRSKMAT